MAKITKLEAGKRQLDAAIRMFFNNEESVAKSSWPHRAFDRAYEGKQYTARKREPCMSATRLYFSGQKRRAYLVAIDLPLVEGLT
jgi:hypothetical protein